MKNFGFLQPKHSVLKNQPKLPIIQRKFRLKPTKHSSQSQEARSFVFLKILNLRFYFPHMKYGKLLVSLPKNHSSIVCARDKSQNISVHKQKLNKQKDRLKKKRRGTFHQQPSRY
jgi:hypothetical protein